MNEIISNMIDFAEENWAAFIQRCEERGMSETVAEKLIEELKADLFS